VARTADRTLTLVLDPDDDVDTLIRMRRLHARPLGQIVCEPAPGDGTAGLDLPLGAGLAFPYLSAIHDLFNPVPRQRVRTTLTRDLSRAERAAVYDTWDRSHDWITRWLHDHAEWTYQQAADAVLALACAGDTASEIYVRIRAALDAFQHAGIKTHSAPSMPSSSTASARPDPAS
jgi:hypothetical protein